MFSPQRSRIHTHIHTCQVTSVMSYSLWPRDCSPPGSSVQGDTPGKNTRVGSHALLQGIFPTEGSNLHLLWLLHFRGILTTDPAGKRPPHPHTHTSEVSLECNYNKYPKCRKIWVYYSTCNCARKFSSQRKFILQLYRIKFIECCCCCC